MMEVINGTATLTVSDNGIGIRKTDHLQIFELFSRAISQEAGSGVGLYNVKGALLKLNGEITVDSELHQGTIFKVIILSK